jgi:hypothetical protein
MRRMNTAGGGGGGREVFSGWLGASVGGLGVTFSELLPFSGRQVWLVPQISLKI